MGIPFNVYLPPNTYKEAKEISQNEGIPISFLIREGLRLVLEKRKLPPATPRANLKRAILEAQGFDIVPHWLMEMVFKVADLRNS